MVEVMGRGSGEGGGGGGERRGERGGGRGRSGVGVVRLRGLRLWPLMSTIEPRWTCETASQYYGRSTKDKDPKLQLQTVSTQK